MTVSTPHPTRRIAPTPLVTRPCAPTHVSPPHVALRPERANGSFASSSTPPISHSTAHISSTHSLVARSNASSHVSYSHVSSRPEQASVSSNSSSTPHLSHSTVHNSSPPSSSPRRKRSRRCFVCGGTGKHRLNPRFCPRTFELLSKCLAKFDATFRLVSFDGSPLPMTRHPGGVAAHLMSPRRLCPCTLRGSPRSATKLPGGSHSNPPHVPHAPHAMPAFVPRRVPNAVPTADSIPSHVPRANLPHCAPGTSRDTDLNSPHAPRPSAIKRRYIPSTERSLESNSLHFPPVERLPSPPIYLPAHVPLPDSKPPADASFEDSSPHVTLTIFELLFISPPVRNRLRSLIDAMNGSNVCYDIPSSPHLRKVFFRILEKITDLLSSPR
ncbi:hypothetical protein B0H11DRAFT_2012867 [Mycena galericulata]|nr:hypothetical protein B0H11DRAFT_2012867 [Mycena galericulata]